MPLFLQQNLFSHDKAHKNVCGIPNSEARMFMYGFKKQSFQQGAIQSVYISCYRVKIKALISVMFSVQLICANIFAYAKIQFSHDAKVGLESVQKA